MDEKIYKVTLADGTELAGLSMNGNNFISAVPVDADIFTANCSPVAISDGEKEEIHEHMELVQVTVVDDLTTAELEQEKMKSDIEYIAMMCDVEL